MRRRVAMLSALKVLAGGRNDIEAPALRHVGDENRRELIRVDVQRIGQTLLILIRALDDRERRLLRELAQARQIIRRSGRRVGLALLPDDHQPLCVATLESLRDLTGRRKVVVRSDDLRREFCDFRLDRGLFRSGTLRHGRGLAGFGDICLRALPPQCGLGAAGSLGAGSRCGRSIAQAGDFDRFRLFDDVVFRSRNCVRDLNLELSRVDSEDQRRRRRGRLQIDGDGHRR